MYGGSATYTGHTSRRAEPELNRSNYESVALLFSHRYVCGHACFCEGTHGATDTVRKLSVFGKNYAWLIRSLVAIKNIHITYNIYYYTYTYMSSCMAKLLREN